MKIRETTAAEYKDIFGRHPHIYNSAEFSELNRYKADRLYYLLFEDSKTRFGIVLGDDGERLLSPFSASFGGFSTSKHQSVMLTDEAARLLKSFGESLHKKVIVTLPPTIYEASQPVRSISSLSREGRIRHIDINYHFDTTLFPDYENIIERNARKNLHKALKEPFAFTHIRDNDDEGIIRAYNVIKANREEHGYPLRMSAEDVLMTVKTIPADFFILTHSGHDVAAAQVFHVADDICQVIYWGNIGSYNSLRPMNILAYRIFGFYHDKGVRILDIGPSTEQGTPNYGLCDFKESIGCSTSCKFSFEL